MNGGTQIHTNFADHSIFSHHRRQIEINLSIPLELGDIGQKVAQGGNALAKINAGVLRRCKPLDIDLLPLCTDSEGNVFTKNCTAAARDRIGIITRPDGKFKRRHRCTTADNLKVTFQSKGAAPSHALAVGIQSGLHYLACASAPLSNARSSLADCPARPGGRQNQNHRALSAARPSH